MNHQPKSVRPQPLQSYDIFETIMDWPLSEKDNPKNRSHSSWPITSYARILCKWKFNNQDDGPFLCQIMMLFPGRLLVLLKVQPLWCLMLAGSCQCVSHCMINTISPLQSVVKCPLINLKNVNNTQFTAPTMWAQFVLYNWNHFHTAT